MLKSRKAGLLAAICTAGLLAGTAAPAFAESLADAIALAYQTNPTLREQRANLRALDETVVQARSGYRPDVSASLNYGIGYTHYGTPRAGSIFSPAADDTRGSTTSAAINIDQPLYTGGRVRSQINAAQADIETGRQNLRSVESSVLSQVIQFYVDVRRDIESLRIADENVAVLQRQLDEARARFEVGEITRTDVAQAEARLAASKSQQSNARAQLAISRANYAQVVGQNPGDLEAEPSLVELLPASIEDAFQMAEENNPALLAANYAEEASRARVAQAKAATRPSISLRGQVDAQGSSVTNNPFDSPDRGVSGSVALTVPLFSGGQISSAIRQAQEQNNADAAAIEGARRAAQQDVAQAWNQLLGARAALASNEEQVRAARIAFEGVRQEAQVGLRTTLDVLNAQQELRNAELALINARRDEYLAGAFVLAAVGKLEARWLTPDQTLYDPKSSYKKVYRSFGWVPWEPAIAAIDHVLAPRIGPAPDEAVKTANK